MELTRSGTPWREAPAPPIRAGRFCVRWCRDDDELRAAQALRLRTLIMECGGDASAMMRSTGREQDALDAHAMHVVVVDESSTPAAVVGTVRLTDRSTLPTDLELYTQTAFDLTRLLDHYDRPLELSRFCIAPQRRSGVILKLLWRFLMRHIQAQAHDLMLGCGSFPGTRAELHAPAFRALIDAGRLLPARCMPVARSGAAVSLHTLAANTPATTDGVLETMAAEAVPTLLRAYLKLGARISDHAMIDPVFNTTFVVIAVAAADLWHSESRLNPAIATVADR